MARSYVLTDIIDPIKAPFSKRSLEHLNTALEDISKQLIESQLSTTYTTNDVIILNGCKVTASIPGTSSVTAGRIYYNGKIYDVDVNASISTPANTLVWSIATTYISGDPATFSDGNSYNFHKIEKFQLTNAVSGSGIADYNGATVKRKIRQIKQNIGVWDMDATTNVFATNSEIDSYSKVFDVRAMIINDAGTSIKELTSDGLVEVDLSGNQIVLARTISGSFDSVDYNDAVMNRGYIYITWGDI